MIALLALAVLAPTEMRLPAGGMCPDAVRQGSAVHVVYGDGKDGWYTRYGLNSQVRINSDPGSVHAMGERGPKIALGDQAICAAWQGDYRKGPVVSFTRSTDGGRTFEPQRNLIQGRTPGLDHVGIAAEGKEVVVFWLDGRGGQDSDAPVTSTIWYSLSTDSGKSFGPNQQITASPKVRACACCSMAATIEGGQLKIYYRSGVQNVRDIWMVRGDPTGNAWKNQAISSTGWVFPGCPMDGPRIAGGSVVFTINGTCYLKSPNKAAVRLGSGKYPGVCETANGIFTTVQGDAGISWAIDGRPAANMLSGSNGRAAVVNTGSGPLLIR